MDKIESVARQIARSLGNESLWSGLITISTEIVDEFRAQERDVIAREAMVGIIGGRHERTLTAGEIASQSYIMADVMIDHSGRY